MGIYGEKGGSYGEKDACIRRYTGREREKEENGERGGVRFRWEDLRLDRGKVGF